MPKDVVSRKYSYTDIVLRFRNMQIDWFVCMFENVHHKPEILILLSNRKSHIYRTLLHIFYTKKKTFQNSLIRVSPLQG